MATPKPLSKREAEAALRSDDPRALSDALKRLPVDVDPTLAARVVLERLDARTWAFARTCQQLPAPVIREAMKQQVLALDVAPPSVSVRVTINSVEENRNRVPHYQGSLTLDSQWDRWWSLHVSKVDDSPGYRATSFGADGAERDDLGLGRCTLQELPTWLAAAQKKLRVHWYVVDTVYGSLRGKKRAQLCTWVFGAVQARR